MEAVTISVDKPDWKQFGEVCDQKGYNRSKLLRNWIKRFLEKNKCE